MNRRNSDRQVKNLCQYVIKNDNQKQTSFRVPDSQYFQNHPQAPSYSSVVKGQINPKASSPVSGNEPAAAGIPLNRGGITNQYWGNQTSQSQIKLISEICMQVMKNLPGMNQWI